MIERPEIVGSIIDVDEKPISNARVTIIGSRTIDSIIEDYEVESERSDGKGKFKFRKIKRIDWVHGYKILARAPCSRRLKIEATGYMSRLIRVEHNGKYNQLNDNQQRLFR